MKPKIAIITATYNSEKTLEQTILSVAAQTYNNIEYIIIDGGSTDGTIDIIKKYADKIAYWVSEPDKGIYDAFNKGIAVATGDYIEFLGSDDSLYAKDTIEKIAAEIEENTDILSGGIFMIDETAHIEKYLGNLSARDRTKFIGEMIPHPGMFVKRELLEKYQFDTSYKITADYKCFLQLYYDTEAQFKFIDLPVTYFTTEGISSKNESLLQKENFRIWDEFGVDILKRRYLSQKESFFKNAIKTILKAMHLFTQVKYILDTHFRGWRKHHCEWEHCRWCGR